MILLLPVACTYSLIYRYRIYSHFLWDVVVCIVYYTIHGPQFLMHAVLCCMLFLNILVLYGHVVGFALLWLMRCTLCMLITLTQRPFLMWHGIVFLLYEVSTPFVNFHWFFDKVSRLYYLCVCVCV